MDFKLSNEAYCSVLTSLALLEKGQVHGKFLSNGVALLPDRRIRISREGFDHLYVDGGQGAMDLHTLLQPTDEGVQPPVESVGAFPQTYDPWTAWGELLLDLGGMPWVLIDFPIKLRYVSVVRRRDHAEISVTDDDVIGTYKLEFGPPFDPGLALEVVESFFQRDEDHMMFATVPAGAGELDP
jgi:hypothetical protein